MAPIRDWTGAITISPLPYCEIAAGWRWGICCGKWQKSLCDMVVEWEKVCNFAVSIWCCAY